MTAEAVVRRNLRLTQELLAVHAQLEAAGVSAVPFKGPMLAVQLYGNLAMRQSHDLDFLIDRADLRRAAEVLVSREYRPPALLATPCGARFLDTQRQYRFTRDDGAIVEVHWDLAPNHLPFPVDPESVWSSVEFIHLGGRLVPTVGRSQLLLLLCAHGAKHCWVRLSWIRDVAQLVRVEANTDWEAVVTEARHRGAVRMVLLGLVLAAELCDAPVPLAVIERARSDVAVSSLAREVRERLSTDPPHEPTAWESHRFQFRVRERWRDRIRMMGVLTFIPRVTDLEWVRLPEPLYLLYYVLRPLRLLVKYLVRPVAKYATRVMSRSSGQLQVSGRSAQED